ncbi:hypothetical protein [Allobranchiibius sp. GilTou38]|uniref:hypothetical protein n=1 Tax=Allobranchiibius sp. GilTou38 TaxID=2815210 RepID=UPI001AA0D02E|nr:hypothetical protein [Allobranchiibius sp. GilTou38]MBO1766525.1 hypothetical protein [Allobranchiibius sp. GilTou38]
MGGALGALGAATVAACGAPAAIIPAARTSGPPRTPISTPTSRPSTVPAAAELPGGGRTIFPSRFLFGWCGSPGAPALGQLGVGDLDVELDRMMRAAPAWSTGRRILPVVELIATVVQGAPGGDGLFRARVSDEVISTWLTAARARGALLLLNIQPGRASFLDEARAYEHWLTEPDVGLALDPEWSIRAGQRPGAVFGSTTGEIVNDVAAYLSGLVSAHRLPEKALVVHVLRPSILRDQSALRPHTGVALVKSVDGIGAAQDKTDTYHLVMKDTPAFVAPGFKLFFQEDAQAGPLMTPAQVLALVPRPDYVLYE